MAALDPEDSELAAALIFEKAALERYLASDCLDEENRSTFEREVERLEARIRELTSD